MRELGKMLVLFMLMLVLMFGAMVSTAQEDTADTGGDTPSVVVVDSGTDPQSFQFTVLVGLGMFAVVLITSVFGQRGLDVALQAGGLLVGKTKSTADDQWLIEIAMRNGYAPTRLPDGTIKFAKESVQDEVTKIFSALETEAVKRGGRPPGDETRVRSSGMGDLPIDGSDGR